MNAPHGLSAVKQAALQSRLRGAGMAPPANAIRPRPSGAMAPLSAEQEHVWLHAALAPDVPLYNEAITIHRRGPCKPALLAASLNEVVRRHEIWRTDFVAHDGGIVQRVHATLDVALPFTDLAPLAPQEREVEALRLATADARLPFDLGQAPLLRGRIVRFSDTEHRLYLALHHIIFDGVSIYRVFLPALAAICADLEAGRPAGATAAPPALQYGDYAFWRAQQPDDAAVARQLAYWTETLAGELPVLRLGDHPRPRQPSHRGDMATFTLSGELTERVKRTSLDLGVTPYALLLAAFQTLLFRYSGQTDLVLGGAVDTRRRRALEPLMGYFLNTLPIRTRPAPDLSFRDYARQTRSAVLGMLDASDVPLSRLVRMRQPRRDPGAHPLFQVLFSIEPPAPQFAEGWDLTQMDVAVTAAKFDLYLELDERPEGLIGRFLYSTDLFEQSTISRMIGHWRRLLESAVADPDCPLARLDLLTPAEAGELAGWNDTAQARPDAALHTLFEAQARATPCAVAVVSHERACRYGELDAWADRIAGWLASAGVTPGALVAVCLERSVDMVAALFGILKAGAAYLPLDPTLPPSRLAHCVEEAAATFLLTRPSLTTFPTASLRVLMLDELDTTAPATLPPPPRTDPDSLAYVLCTSGTTGKPKAVEITHRSLVNLLLAMRDAPGFTSADSLLAVTTLSFDIAALELFLPLLCGGRVVLASRAVAADPHLLAGAIERVRPTVMQATPSLWQALVESGWRGLPGLKVLVGGEALSRSLADALLARTDSVWNLYGPTETTVWSTVQRVQPGGGPVPIGRPIANTTATVADPHGNPLPVGGAGELYLGGVGVARGYRNRDELTRQRFVTLPGMPGRFYRTGDTVRRREDGALEWLGRDDDQVKIRGHRVGLVEIEAALECHPAIAAAAVAAHRDSGGMLGLTAYLVAAAGSPPTDAELRRFLARTLPDAMLPGRYVTLPALPLTANGKRDRSALPDPVAPSPSRAGPRPRGAVETRLAGLYAALLDGVAVSADDNFFDLGGHSLLAVRLVNQIEAAFGCRLPLAAVFQFPTVGELASRISAARATAPMPRNEADRALMLRFESLGDDCEFGLVQRRHGAEPLSLLRFTAISHDSLLAALADGFAGIADAAALSVTAGPSSNDYVVHNAHYACSYQTFADAGTSPAAVRDREAAKLHAMRPMLLRVLERGSRLCVVRSRAPMTLDQASALSAALRRHGPTTLLWVRLADAAHPAGTVEWILPAVMIGWIDRYAPQDDPADSSLLWLRLCRQAVRLWQAAADDDAARARSSCGAGLGKRDSEKSASQS